MSVALLFPGQGSKGVLPTLSLAQATPAGPALLARAASAAGLEVAALSARGGRALEDTAVLQPTMVAISLALHGALPGAGRGLEAVAGHSLGEIAAWAASGGLSPEHAVDLAATRGRLMAREAAKDPGGMLALASEAELARALAIGKEHGGAGLAACNAPDEHVVAGSERALRAIAAAVPVRRLPVAGAWHGPGMAGAVEEFTRALQALPRYPARLPWISGEDGEALRDPDAISARLARQLTRPARFTRILATLWARGVRTFVTVGPGAVLRALVRRNLGEEAAVLGTESHRELAQVAAVLGGAS